MKAIWLKRHHPQPINEIVVIARGRYVQRTTNGPARSICVICLKQWDYNSESSGREGGGGVPGVRERERCPNGHLDRALPAPPCLFTNLYGGVERPPPEALPTPSRRPLTPGPFHPALPPLRYIS